MAEQILHAMQLIHENLKNVRQLPEGKRYIERFKSGPVKKVAGDWQKFPKGKLYSLTAIMREHPIVDEIHYSNSGRKTILQWNITTRSFSQGRLTIISLRPELERALKNNGYTLRKYIGRILDIEHKNKKVASILLGLSRPVYSIDLTEGPHLEPLVRLLFGPHVGLPEPRRAPPPGRKIS